MEAVRFAFMSCLDLLDEVIVPEPFYANYEAFATEAGAVIKPVTSTIENGFALPSIAEFRENHYPTHQSDLDLQSQQSDGLPLFRRGVYAVARDCFAARSVPDLR